MSSGWLCSRGYNGRIKVDRFRIGYDYLGTGYGDRQNLSDGWFFTKYVKKKVLGADGTGYLLYDSHGAFSTANAGLM